MMNEPTTRGKFSGSIKELPPFNSTSPTLFKTRQIGRNTIENEIKLL